MSMIKVIEEKRRRVGRSLEEWGRFSWNEEKWAEVRKSGEEYNLLNEQEG